MNNLQSTTSKAWLGALALLSLALAAGAHAQALPQETVEEARAMGDSLFVTRFPIADGEGEIAVPSEADRRAAPVDFATYLMELGERADRATERHNPQLAAKYLRAVTASVPERAAGWVLLCQAYEDAGDKDRALAACAAALQRPGVTLVDYQQYFHISLARTGEVPAQRVRDLDALTAHLTATLPGSPVPAQLRCDLAVRLGAEKRLSECLATLGKIAPEDGKTLGYAWTLAMQQKDYGAALHVVERARSSSLKPDAVEVMARVTDAARSPLARIQPLLPLLLLGVILLGLCALLVQRARRSPLRARARFRTAAFGKVSEP